MEINRENALRLWSKQFGRKTKVKDFAGRQIDRSAYDDRSSRFGWNVDHIYPQSRGGKTEDHNLVCCNIKTNDEKGNSFPCFRANRRAFEIHRRQNHYEIIPKGETTEDINFYDGGQGLEFWEETKETQEYTFVGYVKVRLTSPKKVDLKLQERFRVFLSRMFQTSAVFAGQNVWSTATDIMFTAINFDVPEKKDTQNLLDRVVLLNTYAQAYFEPKYDCRIRIYFGMREYKTEKGLDWKSVERDVLLINRASLASGADYPLAIHGLVWDNTAAKQEVDKSSYHRNSYLSAFDDREGFFPYDKVFPSVKKVLEKRLREER